MTASRIWIGWIASASAFEFKVEAVGLDAGYFTPAVCQGLEERGIAGVRGYRTPNHKRGCSTNGSSSTTRIATNTCGPQGQPRRTARTNRLRYRE
ncbi:transposase, IS4 family [Burkholderia mallei]|nr:transposase, IS4 family [Burkholderia mallei]